MRKGTQKIEIRFLILLSPLAVWTGLEPATFCVTGRRSNQLIYHTVHCSGWRGIGFIAFALQSYNCFCYCANIFAKKFQKNVNLSVFANILAV